MDNKNNTLSFGVFLKSVRLHKGISLEAISLKTKIAKAMLILIEEETHERLPVPAYVKGFVRAYAKAIGADPDEAQLLYDRALNEKETAGRSTQRFRSRSIIFFVAGAGFFMAILCLIFFKDALFVKKTDAPPLTEPAQMQTSTAEKTEAKKTETGKTETEKPYPGQVEQALEKLQLKITAMEKAAIKVIMDGAKPKAYDLKPGDQLELEASSNFNLLIGNAGGVVLTLNGEPVKLSGKSGQAVTLQLP